MGVSDALIEERRKASGQVSSAKAKINSGAHRLAEQRMVCIPPIPSYTVIIMPNCSTNTISIGRKCEQLKTFRVDRGLSGNVK